MPEGDSVLVAATRLHAALAGERLIRTDFRVPAFATSDLSGQVVLEVAPRGKHLFLRTDANELLYMTDVPNLSRPWRAMTALVDTDWYPASYPWHVVLELGRRERRITIARGEPLCRVIPVRRDTYFAQQMSSTAFDDFFARGQSWLATHGTFEHEGIVDITRTYVKQQVKSRFVVIE